jgi:putative transposase
MRMSSTEKLERQLLDYGLGEIHQSLEERVFEFDIKPWLQKVLEDCILTEFEEKKICVEEYERSQKRKNQRNGFYMRSLMTVHGMIKDLKVPRPRFGGFTPVAFERYQRRETKLDKMMTECFWRGISTRDMTHVVHQLTGCHVSASIVTRLTKKWTHEALRWHERPLADEYVYVMLDGVWIKTRSMGSKRRLVLVAYGVKGDGQREIIDYQLSQSESEANWQKFLTALVHRGLKGEKLKLIISDGCKGLGNAVDLVFPWVKHQLCWAHKMRNILSHIKAGDQLKVKQDLGQLFEEKTKTKADVQKILWSFRKKWRHKYPKAINCLERDMERLLHYLECPEAHHRALRTSNHIERQFKEFRRRLRSMEVLPNKNSAERALYALTQIRNEKLKAYPLSFTQNYLH